MTHILIPRTPSMNLLRPFIECPTSELDQAWAAMVRIAEVQHARVGRQCLTQIEEPAAPAAVAGTAEDHSAVLVAARDLISLRTEYAQKTQNAMPGNEYWGARFDAKYQALAAALAAAPALEAPAAPATSAQVQALRRARRALHAIGKTYDDSELRTRALEADEEIDRVLAAAPQAPAVRAALSEGVILAVDKWFSQNTGLGGCSDKDAAELAAIFAAAPQAPAAPSALATQVIENLLQLARIVNVAVEDWGETKEDDSLHVIFHKEQADKLEEILEFFDSLPDAPESEGVILSGPSRAERVQRAQAAPAAPAVDATSDTALLDAMQRHRIALAPEFEGPWDAEIYDDDAEARHIASGNTPREALRAAIAAQAKEGGAA